MKLAYYYSDCRGDLERIILTTKKPADANPGGLHLRAQRWGRLLGGRCTGELGEGVTFDVHIGE